MRMCVTGVRGRRRRGYTVMLVVGAMLFMAGALGVLGVVLAQDVRRTRRAAAEVQLRQMLVASVAVMKEELAARGAGAREVEVRVPVEEGKLILAFSSEESGAEVVARATYRGEKMGQRVKFLRGAVGAWVVGEARMGEAAR